MKYVMFYKPPMDMSRVMALFPAHKANWMPYAERGEMLMIGPFADPSQGAMAIFTSREAAEACAKSDPFVTEGVIGSWEVQEWREVLKP